MGRGELFVTTIIVGTSVKLELPAGENLTHKPSSYTSNILLLTMIILTVTGSSPKLPEAILCASSDYLSAFWLNTTTTTTYMH